jgi:diadenosine tetraphosphate (Ap4A) HIT family hydrolase
MLNVVPVMRNYGTGGSRSAPKSRPTAPPGERSETAPFEEDCLLCKLTPAAGASIEYVDEVSLAFVESGQPGASIAPRAHVASLSDLGGKAGEFLAALRRAANEVQTVYRTSGTMIEPTTAIEGASGHVTYRIVPTVPDGDGEAPEPMAAFPEISRQIAEALGKLGGTSED